MIPMLTDEEISKVMEQARCYGPPKNRAKWVALMAILANYGPRISEVLSTPDRPGIRWDKVDFASHLITFPTLKRRKPMTRTLPLIPAIGDLLREHRLTANGSPYVFPTTKYGRHIVYHVFQVLLHRAGIPPIKLHALRHSCASRLAPIDLIMARDAMGHASIATTDTYLHPIRMRENFARVPAIT